MLNFLLPTTEEFLKHRLAHYTQRYAEEKDFNKRCWLRKELHLIKLNIQTILN